MILGIARGVGLPEVGVSLAAGSSARSSPNSAIGTSLGEGRYSRNSGLHHSRNFRTWAPVVSRILEFSRAQQGEHAEQLS